MLHSKIRKSSSRIQQEHCIFHNIIRQLFVTSFSDVKPRDISYNIRDDPFAFK